LFSIEILSIVDICLHIPVRCHVAVQSVCTSSSSNVALCSADVASCGASKGTFYLSRNNNLIIIKIASISLRLSDEAVR